MTLRTGSGGFRDVAVGVTREEAADTFGEYFDDAFFTCYADFDAEVDLSLLRSLGLVAGDGLSAVLPRVLATHNTPGASVLRVLVGLPPDVGPGDAARRVLAEHPSHTVGRVHRAGEHVLLSLEPCEAAAPADPEAVLAQLTAHEAAPAADEPPADVSDTHSLEVPGPTATSSTSGVGRRPLALAAALVLAVVALGLTVIGLALGAEALLVGAVLVLAVVQALVLVGILYVVRLLRDLTREVSDGRGDEAAFRKQMRRRTNRIVRLTQEGTRLQREGLVAHQKTRNEVATVSNRVLAVGRLLGRITARDRDESRGRRPPEPPTA